MSYIKVCDGCDRTYTSASAYAGHLSGCTRKKVLRLQRECQACDYAEKAVQESDAVEQLNRVNERVLASIESRYLDGLSDMRYEHYCSNASVQQAKQLFHDVNMLQRKAIERILKNAPADADLDTLLDDVFSATTKYLSRASEMSSCSRRVKYNVMPAARSLGQLANSVTLGERRILHSESAVMYDVPLDQQIQRQLFYDREFAHLLIDWGDLSTSDDGTIASIQDGYVARTHPELSAPRHPDDPRRLAFGLYADEVEVANPLGAARTKHKVTLYYTTILNLPPHVRSEMDYIFLTAVVLSKHQQSVGCQRVIQGRKESGTITSRIIIQACSSGDTQSSMSSSNPMHPCPGSGTKSTTFYSMMHKFASPEGVTFSVPKLNEPGYEVIAYRGFLLLLSADTLAAAELIGFKRGFGPKVLSPCWQCYCKASTMSRLTGHVLRTVHEYESQRSFAASRPAANCARSANARPQRPQQKGNRQSGAQNNQPSGAQAWRSCTHASVHVCQCTQKQYMDSLGISTFNHGLEGLPHFSPVLNVPRDLMHVELEGTLKAHLFGVLYMALVKLKWFTLEQFNAAIRAWPFHEHSSHPDILYSLPKGEHIQLLYSCIACGFTLLTILRHPCP